MKLQASIYSLLALSAIWRGLAGEATTTEWGPVTNNAQMAISVTSPWSRGFRVADTNAVQTPFIVKGEIKAGEPFSLLVRIRNLSTNETLNFYNALQPTTDKKAGLACLVISPSGKDVSPTSEATIVSGSGAFTIARPNETIEFEFPLSQLCVLEEVGSYKITATKRTYLRHKGDKASLLTSNTLCVSVIPGK